MISALAGPVPVHQYRPKKNDELAGHVAAFSLCLSVARIGTPPLLAAACAFEPCRSVNARFDSN